MGIECVSQLQLITDNSLFADKLVAEKAFCSQTPSQLSKAGLVGQAAIGSGT